jgi:hypothetical protein
MNFARVNASHSCNQEFGGNGFTVSGLVGGPIAGDRLLAQVSASFSNIDGVMKAVNVNEFVNGGQNATLLGKMIFNASDDVKLTSGADYYKTDDEPSVYLHPPERRSEGQQFPLWCIRLKSDRRSSHTQIVSINPTRLLEIWGPSRTIGVRVGAEW